MTSASSSLRSILEQMYRLLDEHYGDLHWWLAESPWEVVIGAILTQNTAWQNVEKGIANLKRAGLLASPSLLQKAAPEAIEAQIQPCGYYRQKTLKLKAIAAFWQEKYGGQREVLPKNAIPTLRAELLAIWGIGKETADSILLYALEVPIFVVDAYTKRVLLRHGLCEEKAGYDELQQGFHAALGDDGGQMVSGSAVPLFQQFHALIVNVGKDFCKKSTPNCEACPLGGLAQASGFCSM